MNLPQTGGSEWRELEPIEQFPGWSSELTLEAVDDERGDHWWRLVTRLVEGVGRGLGNEPRLPVHDLRDLQRSTTQLGGGFVELTGRTEPGIVSAIAEAKGTPELLGHHPRTSPEGGGANDRDTRHRAHWLAEIAHVCQRRSLARLMRRGSSPNAKLRTRAPMLSSRCFGRMRFNGCDS